jgi:hypothetical protein
MSPLRQAGADLHVHERVAHGDHAFQFNRPECAEHYRELNAFLLHHHLSVSDVEAGGQQGPQV